MQPANWIQFALTLATFVVGGIIFYFKNLETVRGEIRASENRLGLRIDGLAGDVHRLDVTVTRLDERMNGLGERMNGLERAVHRGRLPEPASAE